MINSKCLSMLACIGLLCFFGCQQKNEHQSKAEPVKESLIFQEKQKMFMHLEPCDTLHVAFKYVNQTKSKQLIDSVDASCGCMRISYQQTPIMPNDTGAVNVAIDMKGINSFFSKWIVVYSHESAPIMLKVRGKIEAKNMVKT